MVVISIPFEMLFLGEVLVLFSTVLGILLNSYFLLALECFRLSSVLVVL